MKTQAERSSTEQAGFEAVKPRLTTTHGLLFQSDCLELLRAIRTESINTIFADPPFNLNKEYKNGFIDRMEDEEYLDWSFKWIKECERILVPGGALFIYSLPRWAFQFAAKLNETMDFRHWIALSMKGSFPRGKRLYPAHYALLYFTKGDPEQFTKVRVPLSTCRHCKRELKDYGGYRNLLHPEGVTLSDFWEDTSPNRHKGSKARAGVNELKPVIPARALGISTAPEDIVLDPFGGGGSTYQEAQRMSRYWIGSELGDCGAIEKRFRLFAPTTLGRTPPQKVWDVFL